jgi:hypothetical protein
MGDKPSAMVRRTVRRDHLDQGVDKRTIFKWILKKRMVECGLDLSCSVEGPITSTMDLKKKRW